MTTLTIVVIQSIPPHTTIVADKGRRRTSVDLAGKRQQIINNKSPRPRRKGVGQARVSPPNCFVVVVVAYH